MTGYAALFKGKEEAGGLSIYMKIFGAYQTLLIVMVRIF